MPKIKLKSKVEKPSNTTNLKSPIHAMYANKLDEMEKKFNITSQSFTTPGRLSSGMLVMDMVYSGGLTAGAMFQVSGLEKGGKTTSCMTFLASALQSNIPILEVWDVENAMNDPTHVENIIKQKISNVFYSKPPRARLYQEAVLEDFYNSSKFLMRSVPDKLYSNEAKGWHFVFDADKIGREKLSDFGFSNTSYDKNLFRSTGRLWVPVEKEDEGIQGIIFCDSYPALVTEAEDENDENSKAMALDARAFSKNIKKIAGILKKKAFVVFGVNQIRENPAARMSSPFYEPGGAALRFNSSLRVRNMPRAVPQGWPQGIKADGGKTSAYGDEPSVIKKGRMDRYAYVMMENTKSKLGTPFLSSMMRIWISDHRGKSQGYDPVFDTYQYLKMTERLKGGIASFTISVGPLEGKKIKWQDFKALILAETMQDSTLTERYMKDIGLSKPLLLRKMLFKEIINKTAFDMVNTGSKGNSEDLEED